MAKHGTIMDTLAHPQSTVTVTSFGSIIAILSHHLVMAMVLFDFVGTKITKHIQASSSQIAGSAMGAAMVSQIVMLDLMRTMIEAAMLSIHNSG